MKPTLRWIPTEVWVDVFRLPWISRKKLARIVHRFRNRKFVEILQFFLHDWGKRTLRSLDLKKSTLPHIPQAPMPENMRFFENIQICHFDSRTVDYLRRVSALFTGVNLNFYKFGFEEDLPKLRTILDHLSPLIHGIHSITFDHLAIPLMEQHFGEKLAHIKVLRFNLDTDVEQPAFEATIQAAINYCLNWLTSGERDSTEPKLLELESFEPGFGIFQQISAAVQQHFLSAKSACTFAIDFDDLFDDYPSADGDFHLENKLGEQLRGQAKGAGRFRILRHQPNGGTALQEWAEEITEKCYNTSVIDVYDEVTIGPITENTNGNEVDAGGVEEDGPSTSKKPKLT